MTLGRWFRIPRQRRQPYLALSITVLLVLLVVKPLLGPSYSQPPRHFRALEQRCEGWPESKAGCANPFGEKVFISISLYDGGGRLAGGPWGEALLALIHLIGPDNVFLSIYESDSGPEGGGALESLKNRLSCRHSVVSEQQASLDGLPSVRLPDGSMRIKRIAFLAAMRNRALRPLDTFAAGDTRYDKVLFMNDVIYRPMDAAQLLFSTNLGHDGRTRYLTACGLDYLNPAVYYDTFATRDSEGYSIGVPLFPIFTRSGKAGSRAAMLAGKDVVPVKSCWGGIVAADARHIQNTNGSLEAVDFTIDPANPKSVTAPVRFRHEPELFLDACECCLFLADLAHVAKQESISPDETGVFVNPHVRVAYQHEKLAWVDWLRKWERLFALPQAMLSPLIPLPRRNPYRPVQEGQDFEEEIWVGEGDAGRWELVPRKGRTGLFCSIRSMQVIRTRDETNTKNWEGLALPPGQTLPFPK
ncbi:hypothetical protein GQ53DRAFT_848618 [Thozetella sp. PMI_491]|nr:hypothetical protein GQ53DRAFT_848618 [Thozetella sp. PMI_491]